MKITVITVAFNSAATIADTVSSVRGQTHVDFEHLVVDGGSTDNTAEIVQAQKHDHLVFSSELDKGIYDAMNKGVQQASGEIIGILNSDDFYMHTNVLKEVADAFALDPDLDAVLGDVDFVIDDDLVRPVRTYRAGFFRPWMFQIGLMPPHTAVFVRKSAYERVGCYKLGYMIAADFDFLVRLLSIDGAKYITVHQHWVRMRTGGVSTSCWRSNLVITWEMLRSLRENGLFSCLPMLMVRFPVKFIRQVLL